MRLLITDPAIVPPARYRRFIQRAVCRGLLADHLSHGRPYLALNALVLSPAELTRLIQISTCFARIFAWAGRCVAQDVDTLVAMGFPWLVAEMLRAEPEAPVLLGRFDFVADATGHWWLVEYNADTPSGIREAIAADEVAFEMLQGDGLRRVNDQLAPRLVAAFQMAVGPGDRPRRLGLVTDAAVLEDLGQLAFTARLLQPSLAKDHVEIVLGDIDNLTRAAGQRVALCGRPIDMLYRLYPFETLLGRSAFSAIVDAVAAGRLRLLNGLRGLLLQNKGLLAWIWAHRADPALAPTDQAIIVDHLPPTWWIGDVPSDVDRQDLVVKQVFGREGEEVFFGDRLSAADWDRCRRWGSYIAQQRIPVPGLPAIVWNWRGDAARATRWATVGSFVVAGAWAGCYTRLGEPIVTDDAQFVPTAIGPADETRAPDGAGGGSVWQSHGTHSIKRSIPSIPMLKA